MRKTVVVKRKRRGQKRLTSGQKTQVKALITRRQELKYLNVIQGGFPPLALGSILQLSKIAQGDSDSQRNGDSMLFKPRMQVRLNMSTLGNGYMRIIIFQWKPLSDDTNFTPTVGDILHVGSTTAVDFTSQYQYDTRHQYRIMKDKVFTLVNATQTMVRTFIFSCTIPNKRVQFSAATTIGTNQIYMLAIRGGSQIDVAFTAKFIYTDS